MAFRYDSASGLVTLFANLEDLQVEGTRRRSGSCKHGAKANTKGLPARKDSSAAGGQRAFADHELSEAQDTTIVIPAPLPLVIVTSDPTSACEDAARLKTEWGA